MPLGDYLRQTLKWKTFKSVDTYGNRTYNAEQLIVGRVRNKATTVVTPTGSAVVASKVAIVSADVAVGDLLEGLQVKAISDYCSSDGSVIGKRVVM